MYVQLFRYIWVNDFKHSSQKMKILLDVLLKGLSRNDRQPPRYGFEWKTKKACEIIEAADISHATIFSLILHEKLDVKKTSARQHKGNRLVF